MKLKKDGVDVCDVGFIIKGPPHTENAPRFFGTSKGGETITESTYYVDCPIPINLQGGRFSLAQDGVETPIRPFDYASTEVKNDIDEIVHRIRFTTVWPKEWL